MNVNFTSTGGIEAKFDDNENQLSDETKLAMIDKFASVLIARSKEYTEQQRIFAKNNMYTLYANGIYAGLNIMSPSEFIK